MLYILGIIGVTFDLGKIPTKIREKISGAIRTVGPSPLVTLLSNHSTSTVTNNSVTERVKLTGNLVLR